MNRLKQFMKSEYNQKNIFNKMKLEVGLDADYGYMEMMDESDDYDQNQDDDVIDNEHQFGYDVEEETEESVEQPKIKFNGDR